MATDLTITELCLPGETCPIPVLKTKKALTKMAAGEKIRVISTDPHSIPDLKEFCTQTGHHYLEENTREGECGVEYISLIARRD